MPPISVPSHVCFWCTSIILVNGATTFHGAEATVCTANGESTPFPIQHGICQGCFLAPYLFFFIGEVLNIAIKHAVQANKLGGVILPKKVDKVLIFPIR